jgi:membrane-bound lytic murein transglycosylase A
MKHDARWPARISAKRGLIRLRGLCSSCTAGLSGSKISLYSVPLRSSNWTQPILVPRRDLLLFITALAIFVPPEETEARRYSSSPVLHVETQSIAGSPPAKAAVAVDPPSGPLKILNAALEPVNWSDLDGWAGDDHASAFATFYASCRPIVRANALRAEAAQFHPVRDWPVRTQPAADARKRPPQGDVDARKRPIPPRPPSSPPESRPVRSALEQVCARAVTAGQLDPGTARQFFEANFVPVRIRKLGDPAGFLTGYYEPVVDGSRFPTREFTVPLYRRPRDLVAPGVVAGAPFPNTGRAFRQTPTGELVPYYDRGEIEDGALDGQHLEICWLRSAADALSVQIEGSARVRLEDGTLLRVSYDAHNGYPFVSVSRLLIERHLVAREEMSIQRIREWMHDNPDEAKAVRRQNRQVVFFRIVGLNDDNEAIGAQGIPLTAGRSIAVDKSLHVYGTPFFIEADLQLPGLPSPSPFRRLMIAQDTGSAIVGPARADLFFGAGEEAGQMAGRIQQPGRFAMLVPRELGPSITSANVPLPPSKPAPSLDSYAFCPVVPPAKPEPLRMLRPATLDRIARSARSEPSQLAARALRSGAPHPLEPSAKCEPSRVAAPTPAEPPPPTKQKPSQVAARVRQPDAPPVVTKPGLSEVGARTFHPAVRAPGKPGQPTLDRIAPSARSEPSQLAARAPRSGTPHPLEPSAKREPSRVAAPTSAEPPLPAKPRPSHVAARARQPDAPPVVTKPGLSEVGARTFQPTARAPRKPGQGASPSAHEIARRPHRLATRI